MLARRYPLPGRRGPKDHSRSGASGRTSASRAHSLLAHLSSYLATSRGLYSSWVRGRSAAVRV
ncbi:MAG: hypothetical protein OJF62_000081 [Pseudolabrys sp.]|nr:hypothetical protein [Pseudolabrys sp.]